MNMTRLTECLDPALYPIMIVAGITWGASGEAGSGLAALLAAAVVFAVLPLYPRN